MATAYVFVAVIQNYSKLQRAGDEDLKYNLGEVFPFLVTVKLLYNVYISRPWLSDLFNSIADCTFPFEVNIKTDAATEMANPTVSSRGKR